MFWIFLYPFSSLDSDFLASTSTNGSACIWKTNEGVPLTSLTRNSDEQIECCQFFRDGTKPFLFCTVQKGNITVTTVWDISTWNRIGYKKLFGKPIFILSINLDGKYLAMVVLSISGQWGPVVTKLNVYADWKEWQIYLLLLGLFLASTVVFYIFFENSDSFWNFPLGRDQPAKLKIEAIFGNPKLLDDQNAWEAFGPLDL